MKDWRQDIWKRIWFRIYSVIVGLGVLGGVFMYGQSDGIIVEESLDAAADTALDTSPRIALTFDDGPHEIYTPMLLDGLKERGVKASFFLIGQNIVGNEAIVKRIAEDGHLIGNHTWSHVKITDLETADACAEIIRVNDLVKRITGKETEYVRPPFGTWNRELECTFHMLPVMWSIDTRDWTTKNVNCIVTRGTSCIQADDIILLHDCYGSSVEAALKIVDELLTDGYEFVTVDKLILE